MSETAAAEARADGGGAPGGAAPAGKDQVAAAAGGKVLSEEEIEEFRELFMMVDTDGGGSIDRMELKQLLDTIGVYPTVEEVNMIFLEVDDSDDGDIQFEEFVQFMSGGVIKGFSAARVSEAFEMFRRPGVPEGHLPLEDLKKAFMEYVPDKFQAEGLVDDLLNHITADENGNFNFQEYVDLMLRDSGEPAAGQGLAPSGEHATSSEYDDHTD